jgi:hypothetical protein
LRQDWEAPVTAVIGQTPASHFSKKRMEQYLVRAAELLGVGVLVLCLALSLGDSTFLQNLFHDPWLAVGQAWFDWRLH